jgi:glucose/arabinose dehydrogenase
MSPSSRSPVRPTRHHLARRWPAAILTASVLLAGCAPERDPEGIDLQQQPSDPSTDPDDDADDGPGDADGATDPPAEEGADEDVSQDDGAQRPEVDLDVALTLTDVVSMSSPIAGAVGPDGTLYLAERAGTVHPLTADGLGSPVLDISAQTTTDGERGLLGLAFSANGDELYVSSTDRDGDTLISAYPVDGDGVVDGGTSRTVYTLGQPRANHNGGDVEVGPDGYLYVGLGDGGGGGDPEGAGQDLTTALGAMLRIDPAGGDPYAIPPDNPFLDDDGAVDEIWAYGLRNPWRFSFDRETGDLWIADVGQDAIEEVNRVPAGEGAGANFGWNLMEGTREFAGGEPDDHWAPIHDHEHTEGRCSITGGYVYRGERIPELTGVYLFTDLCNSTVRALHVSPDGEVVEERALDIAGQQVVSFAQDAEGELYLLDFGGAVRRIDPA